MKSTENYSQRIDSLRNLITEADALIIGAGSGLSTAAGLDYAGEVFRREFAPWIKRYGITDLYTSSFYPFETEEELAYQVEEICSNPINYVSVTEDARPTLESYFENKMADAESAARYVYRDYLNIGYTKSSNVGTAGASGIIEDEIDGKTGFPLFRSAKKKIEALKMKYDKVEKSIDNIVNVLDGHQITLLKDIAVLDKLYDADLVYFKELSMYIIAGKTKLEQERATTLQELRNKAQESGLPEDAQKASDFADKCDRFERKIYDLELSRTVAMQMGPQIRLVQSNDALMSEKIRSTIVNTIPLWKSQMIIALGLAHSEEALRAEHAVNDMTNELLKKNAALLHQSTVQTAKESERGIIDIETLTMTNKELIDTLDDVRRIHVEGKQKRIAAEGELARIEEELRNKLLELRDQ